MIPRRARWAVWLGTIALGCSGGASEPAPITEAPATTTSTIAPTPPPDPDACPADPARDARIAEIGAALEGRLAARGASQATVSFFEAVLAWHAANPCRHRVASFVEERDTSDAPEFATSAIGTSDTGPWGATITHWPVWNDDRTNVGRHLRDAWQASIGELVSLVEVSPDRAPLPRIRLHQRVITAGRWTMPGLTDVSGIALEETLELTAPVGDGSGPTTALVLSVPLPREYVHMQVEWTSEPGALPPSSAVYTPALRAMLERASLRLPMLAGVLDPPPSVAVLLPFHGRYLVTAEIDPAPCAGDALSFPSTTSTLDAFDGELILANVPRVYVASLLPTGELRAEAVANDDTSCPDEPRAHEIFTVRAEGEQLRGRHASAWHLPPHCERECAIGGPMVLTRM